MRKMTLFSVYKWFKAQSLDLFSGIELPEGVNRDSTLGSLLREAGEMGVLYDDPDFFRESIDFWSDEHKHSFEQIYKALTAEYGIVDNFNRIETIKDTTTTSKTGTESGSRTTENTATMSGTETGTVKDEGTTSIEATTSDSAEVTDIDYVAAFDSNTFSEKTKKDSTSSSTITGDTDQTNSNTNTRNLASSNSNQSNGTDSTNAEMSEDTNTTYTRTAHLSGNIGVTTSQQMIEAELALRINSSFITIFKDLFIDELLIQTY